MNTNKFLVAGVAGGVVHFLLGYLLWGILFMKFFEANSGSASGVSKDPMLFWGIGLSSLIFGLFISYIFSRWAGISTFMGGLTGGAVIGLLMGASYDLMTYSTTNLMNMNGMLVNILLMTIITALVGGVVGLALGMGKK